MRASSVTHQTISHALSARYVSKTFQKQEPWRSANIVSRRRMSHLTTLVAPNGVLLSTRVFVYRCIFLKVPGTWQNRYALSESPL